MHRIMFRLSIGISNFILLEVHLGVILFETGVRVEAWLMRTCLAVKVSTSAAPRCLPVASRGVGGVVVIDAAIGAHGCGSRPAHYLTVAATLYKSLTSHCLYSLDKRLSGCYSG